MKKKTILSLGFSNSAELVRGGPVANGAILSSIINTFIVCLYYVGTVIWCNAVQRSVVQCRSVQSISFQGSAVQCSAVQFSAM